MKILNIFIQSKWKMHIIFKYYKDINFNYIPMYVYVCGTRTKFFDTDGCVKKCERTKKKAERKIA